MAANQDYYHLLGVEPTASNADIRKAYRNLAKKYHPDRNIGKPSEAFNQAFTTLQAAKEVLDDPSKRSSYDKTRDDFLRSRHENDTVPTSYSSTPVIVPLFSARASNWSRPKPNMPKPTSDHNFPINNFFSKKPSSYSTPTDYTSPLRRRRTERRTVHNVHSFGRNHSSPLAEDITQQSDTPTEKENRPTDNVQTQQIDVDATHQDTSQASYRMNDPDITMSDVNETYVGETETSTQVNNIPDRPDPSSPFDGLYRGYRDRKSEIDSSTYGHQKARSGSSSHTDEKKGEEYPMYNTLPLKPSPLSPSRTQSSSPDATYNRASGSSPNFDYMNPQKSAVSGEIGTSYGFRHLSKPWPPVFS